MPCDAETSCPALGYGTASLNNGSTVTADELDDVTLVSKCLAGDEAAVRAFIRRFEALVFAMSLRMLGHRQDAEDVAQEVFVRVFRHMECWDASRPLRPWLLTIVANRCRTALERRSKRPKPDLMVLDQASERRPQSQHAQDELEVGEELQLALGQLREDYRLVFVLYHEQELSYQEIAEMLERPEGTIKIWLHRARAQLAEWMLARGYRGKEAS